MACFCAPLAHADVLHDVNNSVGVSLGMSNIHYSEADKLNETGGATLDREKGNQFAFQLSGVREGSIGALSHIYTSLSFSAALGSICYEGYALKDYSTLNFNHSVEQYDVVAKVGKTFRLMPVFQLTPYVSYGFHQWNRFSYDKYNHHEVGLGILAQYAMSQKMVMDLDVNLSEVLGANAHAQGLATQSLSSKPAIGVMLAGDYKLTHNLFVTASYNFKHFSYGQSAFQAGSYHGLYSSTWYEPPSKTNTHTFMVGLKYVL